MWLYLVCIMLCKEECSSSVSLQILRGGIWDGMRGSCLCLCDGDYVSQLPYVWYFVVVNNSIKHVREKCESKRAYGKVMEYHLTHVPLYHQLIMPPINKIVQTLLLSVYSFMPPHANGTN